MTGIIKPNTAKKLRHIDMRKKTKEKEVLGRRFTALQKKKSIRL
jgi:hypothetical protein